MRRVAKGLLSVALFCLLSACGSTIAEPNQTPEINTSDPTIYDLVAAPDQFAGQEVEVEGQYLFKPNGLSVLAKGVSTLDDGTNAEPLDVTVWLEGMPVDIHQSLHQPVDSVYGIVRVRGRFETGGGFGPDGSFQHRLTVSGAEAIEQIKRVSYEAPGDLPEGVVSVAELQADPGKYNGQRVTVRGYYFWTQVSSGLLAEGVQTEEPLDADPATGINPQPMGVPISMEGFPPDKSAALNVGPANGFVWGLIEVSGTFQSGGQFGLEGRHSAQLIIEPDTVTPLEP